MHQTCWKRAQWPTHWDYTHATQGCVLAANLFNTATERILNKTTQAMNLGVNYDDSGQLITYIDYSDDVVIFADVFDTLKYVLLIVNEQSQKLGLHVNWSKTKLKPFSPWIPTLSSTRIGTQPVKTTTNFTYLGTTIDSNNSSYNEVNCRMAITTSALSKLSSMWTSSRLSLAIKMLIHNLDDHLQISLMDTYQSSEETSRCLQHKSPPPYVGRPLVRLCHERLNSYPHRTIPSNDNNPQAAH